MFGSSLPPVVCRRAQGLIYVICAYVRRVVYNTYCVVFLFGFSSSMLSVSLDFLILIAISLFFNVDLL